jgi:hypothetical protein
VVVYKMSSLNAGTYDAAATGLPSLTTAIRRVINGCRIQSQIFQRVLDQSRAVRRKKRRIIRSLAALHFGDCIDQRLGLFRIGLPSSTPIRHINFQSWWSRPAGHFQVFGQLAQCATVARVQQVQQLAPASP